MSHKSPPIGTEGDDFLIGSRHGDEIHGLGGNDYIQGGYGSDTLYGEDGNDTLWGYNEWGVSDVLIGGAGNDTFYFSHPGESLNEDGARDQILDFTPGEDVLRFAEYIAGFTWADVSIADLGGGTFRVYLDTGYNGNDPIPDPWMAIDVISPTGVAPSESDFVFG